MHKLISTLVLVLLFAVSAYAQATPKVELFGNYSYGRVRDENFNGFNVGAAFNVNKNLGLVTEIGGLYKTGDDQVRAFIVISPGGQPSPSSSTFISATREVYTFLAGPRLALRNNSRFTPYIQALFGAYRSEQIETFVIFRNPPTNPNTIFTSRQFSNLLFASKLGGGLDITVNKYLAVRAVEVDYLFLNNLTDNFGRESQNNLRLSFGLVFRFGN